MNICNVRFRNPLRWNRCMRYVITEGEKFLRRHVVIMVRLRNTPSLSFIHHKYVLIAREMVDRTRLPMSGESATTGVSM